MKYRGLPIIFLFALFSSAALAGYTQPAAVDVDLVNNIAGGDQWTARTSEGDTEFIGCGIRKLEDGVGGIYTWGFCQAEDAEGDRALCNTENAELLEGIDSASDFGFLTFSWRVEIIEIPGEDPIERFICTRIGSSIQSFYLPEFKTK